MPKIPGFSEAPIRWMEIIREGMPLSQNYCVLGSFNGLKQFIALFENPYHGLNFCQGPFAMRWLLPYVLVDFMLQCMSPCNFKGSIRMTIFQPSLCLPELPQL